MPPSSRHSIAKWPALPHLKQKPLFVVSFGSTHFARLTKLLGVIFFPLNPPSGSSLASYLCFENLCFPPPKDFSKGLFPLGVSGRPTSLATSRQITTSSSFIIVVERFSLFHTFRLMDLSRLAENTPSCPIADSSRNQIASTSPCTPRHTSRGFGHFATLLLLAP